MALIALLLFRDSVVSSFVCLCIANDHSFSAEVSASGKAVSRSAVVPGPARYCMARQFNDVLAMVGKVPWTTHNNPDARIHDAAQRGT